MDEYCPYCGSSAWFERVDSNGSKNYECTQCHSTSPKSTYEEDDGTDVDILLSTRPGEAAAEQRGYERALDDVKEVLTTEKGDKYGKLAYIVTIPMILDEMKREYEEINQLKSAYAGGKNA